MENFFCDGFDVADEQRAFRSAQRVKLRPCSWRPSPFLANFGEGVGVAGEKSVRGFLGGIAEKSNHVQTDFQLFGFVSAANACFTVKIDERPEAVRFAADDGNHERQPEDAGARERSWRAAHTDPDGQRILQRSRVNGLTVKGWGMVSG